MYFFARLRIYLQTSICGFSHELLVFSIFHRDNVKSESHTPLITHRIDLIKLKFALLQKYQQEFFRSRLSNDGMRNFALIMFMRSKQLGFIIDDTTC